MLYLVAFSIRCGNPTISQGLYGNLTSYDDTGCGGTFAINGIVAAYGKTADPNTLTLVGFSPSGQGGFYQLDLPAGRYCLSETDAQPPSSLSMLEHPFICTWVDVVGLTRCNFEAGPGGGVWLDNNRSFCGVNH